LLPVGRTGARAIESAGIATLTLSVLPAYTWAVGTPRVAGLDCPFGRPFGNPGDAEGQRAVMRVALRSVEAIDHPGGAVQLPLVWRESSAPARVKLRVPPIIARLLQLTPWMLLRFIRGETGE